MNLNFRYTSLLVFVSAIFCAVISYVSNYWLGYYGWDNSGTESILFLVGVILLLGQIAIWIISLLKKNQRLWTTSLLIALLILKVIESNLPAPAILIVHGMRNRIVRDYSVEDIRKFAHDFDRLPNMPDDKTYLKDDLAKAGLDVKYPFLKTFISLQGQGPDAVQELDSVVAISGSRLQGGVYLEVAVNGMKIHPPELKAPVLYLSDDIFISIRD